MESVGGSVKRALVQVAEVERDTRLARERALQKQLRLQLMPRRRSGRVAVISAIVRGAGGADPWWGC